MYFLNDYMIVYNRLFNIDPYLGGQWCQLIWLTFWKHLI